MHARASLRIALLGPILLALMPAIAQADLVYEINEARAEGCGGRKSVTLQLKSSPSLNKAAKQLQRGDKLSAALASVDYRARTSTSLRMSGWLTEASIARNLRKRFCQSLIDPSLREIGIARKGHELWIVFAQPLVVPAPKDINAVSRRVLELTNAARAEGHLCGREYFAATGPLTLSPVLYEAALAHSKDMAKYNYFEHKARDGSQAGERITRTGYRWRVVGENLAAGVATPEEAVQGWLNSPHHCESIMEPRFTQMAVAFAVDNSSDMAIYWTQLFALPR